jgi:hypothetical protein
MEPLDVTAAHGRSPNYRPLSRLVGELLVAGPSTNPGAGNAPKGR